MTEQLILNKEEPKQDYRNDKGTNLNKNEQKTFKHGLDLKVDQSITIMKEPAMKLTQNNDREVHQSYEEQIEQIRKAYEKQISFLQSNLDAEMEQNRQTRDKIIRESNKMIDEERLRTKKLHEEELKRLK